MMQSSEIELTTREIGVLAALVYEPVPRIWIDAEWCCPHCLELNERSAQRCACGVGREAGPQIHHTTEMLEELVAPLELLIAASVSAIGGAIALQ
jgi:hypothetical protein